MLTKRQLIHASLLSLFIFAVSILHIASSFLISNNAKNEEENLPFLAREAGTTSGCAGFTMDGASRASSCGDVAPDMGRLGSQREKNKSTNGAATSALADSIEIKLAHERNADSAATATTSNDETGSSALHVGACVYAWHKWYNDDSFSSSSDLRQRLLELADKEHYIWIEPNSAQSLDSWVDFKEWCVELYRDNGDQEANPSTDTFVGFTLMMDDANLDPGHLFPNLPPGAYFVKFYPLTRHESPELSDTDDSEATLSTNPTVVTNSLVTDHDNSSDTAVMSSATFDVVNHDAPRHQKWKKSIENIGFYTEVGIWE